MQISVNYSLNYYINNLRLINENLRLQKTNNCRYTSKY